MKMQHIYLILPQKEVVLNERGEVSPSTSVYQYTVIHKTNIKNDNLKYLKIKGKI